jgi:hypothetical protein
MTSLNKRKKHLAEFPSLFEIIYLTHSGQVSKTRNEKKFL